VVVKGLTVESFRAEEEFELSFIEDEPIDIVSASEEDDWFWGNFNGVLGLFPIDCVEIIKGNLEDLPAHSFEEMWGEELEEDEEWSEDDEENDTEKQNNSQEAILLDLIATAGKRANEEQEAEDATTSFVKTQILQQVDQEKQQLQEEKLSQLKILEKEKEKEELRKINKEKQKMMSMSDAKNYPCKKCGNSVLIKAGVLFGMCSSCGGLVQRIWTEEDERNFELKQQELLQQKEQEKKQEEEEKERKRQEEQEKLQRLKEQEFENMKRREEERKNKELLDSQRLKQQELERKQREAQEEQERKRREVEEKNRKEAEAMRMREEAKRKFEEEARRREAEEKLRAERAEEEERKKKQEEEAREKETQSTIAMMRKRLEEDRLAQQGVPDPCRPPVGGVGSGVGRGVGRGAGSGVSSGVGTLPTLSPPLQVNAGLSHQSGAPDSRKPPAGGIAVGGALPAPPQGAARQHAGGVGGAFPALPPLQGLPQQSIPDLRRPAGGAVGGARPALPPSDPQRLPAVGSGGVAVDGALPALPPQQGGNGRHPQGTPAPHRLPAGGVDSALLALPPQGDSRRTQQGPQRLPGVAGAGVIPQQHTKTNQGAEARRIPAGAVSILPLVRPPPSATSPSSETDNNVDYDCDSPLPALPDNPNDSQPINNTTESSTNDQPATINKPTQNKNVNQTQVGSVNSATNKSVQHVKLEHVGKRNSLTRISVKLHRGKKKKEKEKPKKEAKKQTKRKSKKLKKAKTMEELPPPLPNRSNTEETLLANNGNLSVSTPTTLISAKNKNVRFS